MLEPFRALAALRGKYTTGPGSRTGLVGDSRPDRSPLRGELGAYPLLSPYGFAGDFVLRAHLRGYSRRPGTTYPDYKRVEQTFIGTFPTGIILEYSVGGF